MNEVQVTFLMEADDPEHSLGLSSSTYEEVNNAIGHVGGYDIEFEKVEALGDDDATRAAKPLRPKKGG
jgi:hypothetical protein